MFGKDKIGKAKFGKTRIAPQTPVALVYKSGRADKREMPHPPQDRRAL